MEGSDDHSFYLYGVGENPEALTLGSLVLGKYWQPLVARHYTHDALNEDELNEFAWSSQLGHPESFLTNRVLPNPRAQDSLKLWLSAARSEYILDFKFSRRPKIWMLTGLYLLDGAHTVTRRGNATDLSVGTSSAVVGALSGIPIGGSVSLGAGTSWEIGMEFRARHVWAAQFRLIDAKYIMTGKTGVCLPTCIGLYKDVLSMNELRGAERDHEDSVELRLDSGHSAEMDTQDDQDSEDFQKFEEELEVAIKAFEGAPKHFFN